MAVIYGVIGQRRIDTGARGDYQQDFDDYEYIDCWLKTHQSDMESLITGGGRGVEVLAERWAKKNSIHVRVVRPPLQMFTEAASHAEQGKASTAAFMVRNTEIINAADQLIAFWSGSDTVIMAAISAATKIGKSVHIHPLI